jgi:hypothetical protein
MSIFLRTFTLATVAIAMAATATAQNAGLLNTFEVQRLVVADTPEAHTALAKHFIALAEVYRADARHYSTLATLPAGNPNHPFGTDARDRRIRQADGAAAAERTARSVAAYHQILSIGGMLRRPAGAAAFDGGMGAPLPSRAELDQLAASADTRAAQRDLVEYFLIVARTESSNAEAYAQMARMTRVSGARSTEAIAARFDRMAGVAREAAHQANLAAELHRQLAAIG